MANLLLLLVVTFIPFPTKLVGEELATRRQMQLGFPTFSVAALVALLSPAVSLALFGAISLFYLLPGEAVERRL